MFSSNVPNGDSRKADQERQGVAQQLMGMWANQSEAARPPAAPVPTARLVDAPAASTDGSTVPSDLPDGTVGRLDREKPGGRIGGGRPQRPTGGRRAPAAAHGRAAGEVAPRGREPSRGRRDPSNPDAESFGKIGELNDGPRSPPMFPTERAERGGFHGDLTGGVTDPGPGYPTFRWEKPGAAVEERWSPCPVTTPMGPVGSWSE